MLVGFILCFYGIVIKRRDEPKGLEKFILYLDIKLIWLILIVVFLKATLHP